MKSKPLFLWIALIIIGLVGAAVLIFWSLPEDTLVAQSSPANPTADPADRKWESAEEARGFTNVSLSPPETSWEEKLTNILASPADTSTAARALISALPNLPPEAQAEYIAHAIHLTGDAEFSPIGEVFLSPGTPLPVIEAIFHEALNRPEEIKLPLLAKALKSPDHPLSAEAREILEVHLGLLPGEAPSGSWDNAVKKYLAHKNSGNN